MKILKKNLFYLLALFCISFLFIGFKITNNIEPQAFFKKLVSDCILLKDKKFTDQSFLCKNIKPIDTENYPDDTTKYVKGPYNVAHFSCADYVYCFNLALTDETVSTYKSKFNNIFKNTFKVNALKNPLIFKYKNKNKTQKVVSIAQFNGESLEMAFNQIYKSPNETIEGFVLQEIYDCSVKKAIRSKINFYNYILTNKPALQKLTNEIFSQAANNELFYCHDYIEKKLFYFGDKAIQNEIKKSLGYAQEIGLFTRRTKDGSLPNIINCAKRIIKDYDPELYKKVKF